MPDKKNAEIFIDSYNKIDAQLRELYGFKPQQSFTDVVRRSAEKNAVVRRYENELTDYARLRSFSPTVGGVHSCRSMRRISSTTSSQGTAMTRPSVLWWTMALRRRA